MVRGGFRVQGSGFRAKVSGSASSCLWLGGFRFSGLRFRVEGLGLGFASSLVRGGFGWTVRGWGGYRVRGRCHGGARARVGGLGLSGFWVWLLGFMGIQGLRLTVLRV